MLDFLDDVTRSLVRLVTMTRTDSNAHANFATFQPANAMDYANAQGTSPARTGFFRDLMKNLFSERFVRIVAYGHNFFSRIEITYRSKENVHSAMFIGAHSLENFFFGNFGIQYLAKDISAHATNPHKQA